MPSANMWMLIPTGAPNASRPKKQHSALAVRTPKKLGRR